MANLVFLHGGGMGGWIWLPIATGLRAGGHTVFTPTFTGFGERSHLISRDIVHDVHVTDIVNVLKFEDLRDVVLVAFSYGGSVAPGVVDRAEGRVVKVIYLDGIVPEAGSSVSAAMGYMTAEQAAGLDAELASGEGPVGSGVDAMQREIANQKPFKMPLEKQEWMLDRMSDMPMRCMVSPVSIGASSIDIPVHYLGIRGDVMEPQHEKARALGWEVTVIGPEVDHAFIAGAPERVLEYIDPRLSA